MKGSLFRQRGINGCFFILCPFNILYFSGKIFKHFLKIRGASAQANPLFKYPWKRGKKGTKNWGKRCVPGNDDGSTEMKGKKRKGWNCREGG